MPTKDELKRAAVAEIDRASDELIEFGDDIFHHAELGFKEHRTAQRVAERFRDLELEYREGLALTGVKGIAPARYAALGLLGVTVVKLFFHDLAKLAQLYRVGALMGVAVIAIVASFLYQRFTSTLARADENETPLSPGP